MPPEPRRSPSRGVDPDPRPARPCGWTGRTSSVPGARRRALLAALARARGRVVGVDRLVDTLWPDDPPADAAQALYNHVSRIRGQLGPAGGRLSHRSAGYVLELGDDELDASVARRVAAELPELPPETVLERAPEALALWRGPALEEFRGHPRARTAEAVALDELKLRLQDELLRARIDVGDDRAVAEARSAVAADPLRERGVLLLMRALAGEGRAAEAMTVGTAYRRRLVDETGLDPGPALARLEQDIASGKIGAGARRRAWPARTVVARPSGPLVGRQQDYDEMLRLHAKHRLVTVTGPGGVGKTRLALEVAAALAERDQIDAVVVDLAAVEDATRSCRRSRRRSGSGSSPRRRPRRWTSPSPWPTRACCWSSTTPSTWPTSAGSWSTPSTGTRRGFACWSPHG